MTDIKAIRDTFEVVALDSQLIDRVIDSGYADFENAVQAHAAFKANADCIVTREPSGFKTVIRPEAYLTSPAGE
jgi:hypothetical protein